MKKIVLFLALATSLSAFGQRKSFSEITFYGVDFSQSKVYGANESAREFQEAFYGINNLFLTEPKKYDVGKQLKLTVRKVTLEAVNKQNQGMNLDQLVIQSEYGGYKLTDEQVRKSIKNLPITPEPGVGMVIMAEVLNKASNTGDYRVVFFNSETKEVLDIWNGKGKAKGFGLRNYWAASVLKMLKDL